MFNKHSGKQGVDVLKKQKIILVEFSKNRKEVDVICGNDDINSALSNNDKKLYEFVQAIKELIPNKFKNKKILINVYITNYDTDPKIITKFGYSIFLIRYISNYIMMNTDSMNSYFRNIIKVALQNIEAKQVVDLHDRL